ncbi:MAG: kelch repeat-containing protein [Saprospiraceae bacterium]|nr:kelch repeat-containing protein [Saprospiraceae bacterium]
MKHFNVHFQQHGGMLCLLMVILTLPSQSLRAQDYWDEVAQMPFSRFLLSGEKVGDLIYLMGGIIPSSATTTQVLAFNPADSSFQPRKPLPKPLAAMATAVYGENIYLFGGIPWSQGPPSQKCYKYVSSLDQWIELPDLPTIPRGYAIAEVLNDKIYVIGGLSESSVTTYNLVEVFDPVVGKWVSESVEQMPTPRGYMGSAVLNGKIYVFGGGTPAPAYAGLSVVEYFDGVNWATAEPMPTQRYGAAAGVLDNTVYVSGGVLTGWSDINVTEGYSETTGWQTFSPLPVDMHGHAVVSFGDVLYAFGGVAGPLMYDDVLVYHPAASSTDNPLIGTGLKVFPNPASEILSFLFENAASGQLTFFRPDGTTVFTETLSGEQQHEFSVAGLPAGVYFWKWVGKKDESIASGKVLVNR